MAAVTLNDQTMTHREWETLMRHLRDAQGGHPLSRTTIALCLGIVETVHPELKTLMQNLWDSQRGAPLPRPAIDALLGIIETLEPEDADESVTSINLGRFLPNP